VYKRGEEGELKGVRTKKHEILRYPFGFAQGRAQNDKKRVERGIKGVRQSTDYRKGKWYNSF